MNWYDVRYFFRSTLGGECLFSHWLRHGLVKWLFRLMLQSELNFLNSKASELIKTAGKFICWYWNVRKVVLKKKEMKNIPKKNIPQKQHIFRWTRLIHFIYLMCYFTVLDRTVQQFVSVAAALKCFINKAGMEWSENFSFFYYQGFFYVKDQRKSYYGNTN